MMKTRRLLILSALSFSLGAGIAAGQPPAAAPAAPAMPGATPPLDVSLDGDWYFHVGDLPSPPRSIPDGLPTMRIPSNWWSQGLDHAGVVWFFREVSLDAPIARGALRFDAVDYAAEVYWDGRRVGEHRGYFAPFYAEIGGEHARADAGPHVLAVRVDSPREPKASWSLRKTLIKGVLSHHDTRPGGAWSERGQDANTGGIWGSVRLSEVQNGVLEDVRVSTLEATPERARISIRASARLLSSARLDYEIRDRDGVAASGVVGPMEVSGSGAAAETTLVLERPRLWWPRELGEPHLYTLELRLSGPGGMDVATRAFGVRTAARDSLGRIVINGQPMFLRGTNYIGSLYYGSFPAQSVRRDLELMVAANVNAVRVHAHVASPDLYRIADELGLLVWQDFPLQWGYEDSDAFTREAKRQAAEMVTLLFNHPSIVFWSGMNEAPWSSSWMAWKYSDYDPNQNRSLSRALAETLREEDPTRPSQGNAHPAEHAWSGWYEGSYRDFARPTAQPMITEFGAQAAPELETLRTFLSEGELWPIEGKNLALWEYHNFQLRELRDNAKVPLGGSVRELIANTQSYQARLTRFAAESLRRQKWQPVVGVFQFMFVEHWPSMSWGAVDYLRRPKPAYAALARAYQPVLVMAAAIPNRKDLALHIVSDRPAKIAGARLVASYVPPRAAPDVELTVDIPANDVVDLAQAIPAPSAAQALRLSLRDELGRIISENDYEPRYFSP